MIKALQGFGVDLDQHSHCRKKGILIIMDKNQIFITSGTEYKRMTKELLEKADLQSHIGDRKKKIGIKPNLVSPSEASWGATTHPEVVAGIIEYLKRCV